MRFLILLFSLILNASAFADVSTPEHSFSEEQINEFNKRLTARFNSMVENHSLIDFFNAYQDIFPKSVNLPTGQDADKVWSPPLMILGMTPSYPSEMRRRSIEGLVRVACLIGEDGVVIDTRVMETTDQMFNVSAVQALRKWKFTPSNLEGKPVKTIYIIPIGFKLDPIVEEVKPGS